MYPVGIDTICKIHLKNISYYIGVCYILRIYAPLLISYVCFIE